MKSVFRGMKSLPTAGLYKLTLKGCQKTSSVAGASDREALAACDPSRFAE
jgi:hypothetical protein